MDDEARDLLEAAGEMAHAALKARAARRDPDEIISRSVEMSRIKTQGILHQLRQPPLAKYSQLSEHDRQSFRTYVSLETREFVEKDFEALFGSLRALCLRRAPSDATETETGSAL